MAKMPQLHFYKVKEVIKIVDGDTVDLLIDLGFETYRKTRVRMSGINAWESRTKNLKEKDCAGELNETARTNNPPPLKHMTLWFEGRLDGVGQVFQDCSAII